VIVRSLVGSSAWVYARAGVARRPGGEMSTIAVVGKGVEEYPLEDFKNVVVAEMQLPGEPGAWVLMGRVTVTNLDGDSQNVTAVLLEKSTGHRLAMEHPYREIPGDNYSICIYLQAGYQARKSGEIIEMEVNTYDGLAERASLIGVRVDSIQFE
jgi:hypothetical protein